MKSTLLLSLFFVAGISGIANAQSTTNTFPPTGGVGINTLNPAQKG